MLSQVTEAQPNEGGVRKLTTTTEKWRLEGYDTFEGERYELEGEYDSEEQATAAAKAVLASLERTQPTEESGGQGGQGIQDHVWVIGPDNAEYRFLG